MVNKLRSLVTWITHIPLFYKIVLANAVVVACVAVVITSLACWHLGGGCLWAHWDLAAGAVVGGVAISLMGNYLVLKVALMPLQRLGAALEIVQKGDLEVSLNAGPVSDAQFDQLMNTLNRILSNLRQQTQQLHNLSQAILHAQEEERQRIARELHDEAAQTLTSVLVYLKLFEKSKNPSEAQAIQNLRQLTVHALEEIRQVVVELRPKILDDWGLGAALGWRVDQLNAAQPPKVTLRVINVQERLPRDLELVFFRVAQEALANVARHARAMSAHVVLERAGDWLVLEVKDDGAGFDLAGRHNHQPRGLGILGMRERLNLVGGELEIQSQPGQGTRLVARAPIAWPVQNGAGREENSGLVGG